MGGPQALFSHPSLERRDEALQLVIGHGERLEGKDLLAHEAAHPLELHLELGFGRKVPRHAHSSAPAAGWRRVASLPDHMPLRHRSAGATAAPSAPGRTDSGFAPTPRGRYRGLPCSPSPAPPRPGKPCPCGTRRPRSRPRLQLAPLGMSPRHRCVRTRSRLGPNGHCSRLPNEPCSTNGACSLARSSSALAALPDSAVVRLASIAHQVRLSWCGPEVEIEGIVSAKTGGCPEDCHFCSQSSRFESPVKATPQLSTDDVLGAARETAALGASEFCIVLAIRGPDERTLERIMALVPLVRAETGLNVAVSAGILTDDQARRLAAAGVHRYNHNLETARSFFPRVVTTHRWEERADTCRTVRRHGMELCCGAIIGMGETDAQRIELLLELRDLDPTEVPVNFLNPRPGTPFADRPVVGAWEAVRWIALFRLALPGVILRYAGGREVTLRDLQAMGMTAGINALIVGNYLTTLGRAPEADLRMLADLRMPVAALTAAF